MLPIAVARHLRARSPLLLTGLKSAGISRWRCCARVRTACPSTANQIFPSTWRASRLSPLYRTVIFGGALSTVVFVRGRQKRCVFAYEPPTIPEAMIREAPLVILVLAIFFFVFFCRGFVCVQRMSFTNCVEAPNLGAACAKTL